MADHDDINITIGGNGSFRSQPACPAFKRFKRDSQDDIEVTLTSTDWGSISRVTLSGFSRQNRTPAHKRGPGVKERLQEPLQLVEAGAQVDELVWTQDEEKEIRFLNSGNRLWPTGLRHIVKFDVTVTPNAGADIVIDPGWDEMP